MKKIKSARKYQQNAKFQRKIANELFEILKEHLPNNRQNPVIDIGAGSGFVAEHLQKLGFNNLYLLDNNLQMCDYIRKHFPSASIIHHNADIIPFDTNYFEMAVSSFALHWLSDGELDNHFGSIAKCLQDNGKYLFAMPIYDSLAEFYDILRASNIHNVTSRMVFPDTEKLDRYAISSGLKLIDFHTKQYEQNFENALQILRYFSQTGTILGGRQEHSAYRLRKNNLMKMQEYYEHGNKGKDGNEKYKLRWRIGFWALEK